MISSSSSAANSALVGANMSAGQERRPSAALGRLAGEQVEAGGSWAELEVGRAMSAKRRKQQNPRRQSGGESCKGKCVCASRKLAAHAPASYRAPPASSRRGLTCARSLTCAHLRADSPIASGGGL